MVVHVFCMQHNKYMRYYTSFSITNAREKPALSYLLQFCALNRTLDGFAVPPYNKERETNTWYSAPVFCTGAGRVCHGMDDCIRHFL